MIVFKLCSETIWEDALRAGRFAGSADDLRDGFIHLSTARQLAGTAAKYFRNQPNLVVVAFDEATLERALRWEASSGGDLFPHHYAPLETSGALWVRPAPIGADGVPVLPVEIAKC